MNFLKRIFRLCVAACWAVGMAASPALAHGANIGTESGGLGQMLIIVISSITLFSLFLVFTHPRKGWTVLVTGGGGYVGSVLVPKLFGRGHRVTVLDLFPRGDDGLKSIQGYADLKHIKGDFGDRQTLEEALRGCDAVLHLACLSNGSRPDSDAFPSLVRAARKAGVKRFLHTSSFCVDGFEDGPESVKAPPLTEHSRHEKYCEKVLAEERAPGFVTCTVRPAVICGCAPAQRLDPIVNALTHDAVNKGRIRIVGGGQKRPTIHIDDITDLYLLLLDQPDARIDGKTFNAGCENLTLLNIAEIVKKVVGDDVSIEVGPAEDLRSYHLSSDGMRRELAFEPRRTTEDAVRDLVAAFRN
jgi:nucleoside-diphosphate-sugar epimerase